MKKLIALLMALVLALTTVCPALALSNGETLKLAVLGDSISYGTGLSKPEALCYGTLVTKHFSSATTLNFARAGDECEDVKKVIGNNAGSLKNFNCYAMSIGSNDYLEYMVDYALKVSEPGKPYFLPFDDMMSFFKDLLGADEQHMARGILNFLNSDQASRTDWKDEFCGMLKNDLTEIIKSLHGCNQDAPILLMNYYSPGDPYANFADKASTLLIAADRNINDAVSLIDRARSACMVQRTILLPMIQTKLVKLAADIYLFVPLLKEFDLNLTLFSPLLALFGVGFVGVEAFSSDRMLLEKLGEIVDLVEGVDQLIKFTDDIMVQMNAMLNEMAKTDPLLVIIDVSKLGKKMENLSSEDHFHPSELGQEIIADKMIAAIEAIYKEK